MRIDDTLSPSRRQTPGSGSRDQAYSLWAPWGPGERARTERGCELRVPLMATLLRGCCQVVAEVEGKKRSMISWNQQLWSLEKKKKKIRDKCWSRGISAVGPHPWALTYALLSRPPSRAFEPQLPSEPPFKGAGLVPLVSSALGTREACALPSTPAHGDARGETSPADPQQPGLPPHRQHRCQAAVPHGGHGLPLHHVLCGGESGPLAQRHRDTGKGPSLHHLPTPGRKKSDLEEKERVWRPGERVGAPPPPLWTSVSPSGSGSHPRIGVHKTKPAVGQRRLVQDEPFESSGVPLLLLPTDHPRPPRFPPPPPLLPLSQLQGQGSGAGRKGLSQAWEGVSGV